MRKEELDKMMYVWNTPTFYQAKETIGVDVLWYDSEGLLKTSISTAIDEKNGKKPEKTLIDLKENPYYGLINGHLFGSNNAIKLGSKGNIKNDLSLSDNDSRPLTIDKNNFCIVIPVTGLNITRKLIPFEDYVIVNDTWLYIDQKENLVFEFNEKTGDYVFYGLEDIMRGEYKRENHQVGIIFPCYYKEDSDKIIQNHNESFLTRFGPKSEHETDFLQTLINNFDALSEDEKANVKASLFAILNGSEYVDYVEVISVYEYLKRSDEITDHDSQLNLEYEYNPLSLQKKTIHEQIFTECVRLGFIDKLCRIPASVFTKNELVGLFDAISFDGISEEIEKSFLGLLDFSGLIEMMYSIHLIDLKRRGEKLPSIFKFIDDKRIEVKRLISFNEQMKMHADTANKKSVFGEYLKEKESDFNYSVSEIYNEYVNDIDTLLFTTEHMDRLKEDSDSIDHIIVTFGIIQEIKRTYNHTYTRFYKYFNDFILSALRSIVQLRLIECNICSFYDYIPFSTDIVSAVRESKMLNNGECDKTIEQTAVSDAHNIVKSINHTMKESNPLFEAFKTRLTEISGIQQLKNDCDNLAYGFFYNRLIDFIDMQFDSLLELSNIATIPLRDDLFHSQFITELDKAGDTTYYRDQMVKILDEATKKDVVHGFDKTKHEFNAIELNLKSKLENYKSDYMIVDSTIRKVSALKKQFENNRKHTEAAAKRVKPNRTKQLSSILANRFHSKIIFSLFEFIFENKAYDSTVRTTKETLIERSKIIDDVFYVLLRLASLYHILKTDNRFSNTLKKNDYMSIINDNVRFENYAIENYDVFDVTSFINDKIGALAQFYADMEKIYILSILGSKDEDVYYEDIALDKKLFRSKFIETIFQNTMITRCGHTLYKQFFYEIESNDQFKTKQFLTMRNILVYNTRMVHTIERAFSHFLLNVIP